MSDKPTAYVVWLRGRYDDEERTTERLRVYGDHDLRRQLADLRERYPDYSIVKYEQVSA